MWIGQRDDLPRVTRVGEDLLVTRHRRVEHDLADGAAGRADRNPAENAAIGERQDGDGLGARVGEEEVGRQQEGSCLTGRAPIVQIHAPWRPSPGRRETRETVAESGGRLRRSGLRAGRARRIGGWTKTFGLYLVECQVRQPGRPRRSCEDRLVTGIATDPDERYRTRERHSRGVGRPTSPVRTRVAVPSDSSARTIERTP